MKRFRKGLVAGKFSPFHLGHEALIEYASTFCDQIVILSYSNPEFAKCDRAERERWIKNRFPQAEVLVLDQQRTDELSEKTGGLRLHVPENGAQSFLHHFFVGSVLLDFLGTTVDAVFTSEDYGDRFAAGLQQYFRDRLTTSPSVQHVCYDKERRQFPFSATEVRENFLGATKMVSANVYASLLPKLAVVGAKASGKTTLAKSLASELDTGWVSDYLCDEEQRLQGDIRYEDVLRIAKTQVKSELVLSRRFGHKLLICDTTPLSLYFYSHANFWLSHYELRRLARRAYDFTVLCAPDFDVDESIVPKSLRHSQHYQYIAELTARGIRHIIVEGSIQQRIAQVRDYVGM